jgi:hypothetical protein
MLCRSILEEGEEVATKTKIKYVLGEDIDLKKEVFLLNNGERLTEAKARQIAKDVLKQVHGRPSLTGPKKVSPEVKARVPEKLKKKLDREAKRQGVTPSAIIRDALESYLSA